MTSDNRLFPYPPLPAGTDAIRILTLEPGRFSDEISASLAPVPFSEKPRYVALSYTWDVSYQENATLPAMPEETAVPGAFRQPGVMVLNGVEFPIRHNLCLALRHLRSRSRPLNLWVDAVCINQKDVGERNTQVALMSFIYRRATNVVIWLGAEDYGVNYSEEMRQNMHVLFNDMTTDWEAGQTQQLADIICKVGQPYYSREPDEDDFARITRSSYWSRLWVVQEACLPFIATVAYGCKLWNIEDLSKWEVLKAAQSSQQDSDTSDARRAVDSLTYMLRILETRSLKHSNEMILHKLIESYCTNACTEVRDRIYGLIGLANDTLPYSKVNTPSPAMTEAIVQAVGHLIIDYSRSLFEVWADVVNCMYAASREERVGSVLRALVSTKSAGPGFSLYIKEPGVERKHLEIVRFSGIAQKALECTYADEFVHAPYVRIPPSLCEINGI
ncbi:heterokaryon incompatibility protein-domain-containing protein [Xylariales sp. AK1849]|nr:heterokaryon incompatibility protein-domain-containing protein [Xylariales sp. AK1849]